MAWELLLFVIGIKMNFLILSQGENKRMELGLFLLVIFSTNLIQGITGFAGTVLAMPCAIMIYGIDIAKPSLTILALLAGALIAAKGYRSIAWKKFLKIIIVMFIGVLQVNIFIRFLRWNCCCKFFRHLS